MNYRNPVITINTLAQSRETLRCGYESDKLNNNDQVNSQPTALAHELIHAGNYVFDNANYFQRNEPFDKKDSNGFPDNEEIRTTILLNQVNEALNEPQRKVYYGIPVPTTTVNSNTIER